MNKISKRSESAVYSFRISFRDKEHFYKIIHWLNQNLGKGRQYWELSGVGVVKFFNKNRKV